MEKKKFIVLLLFLYVFSATAESMANGFLTLPLEDDFDLGCGVHGRNCPKYTNHNGSDYPTVTVGHIVVAAYGGTAKTSDTNKVNDPDIKKPNNYGNYIKIDHGLIDGKKVVTRYSHLLHGSFLINDGDKVVRGQPIAESGNSGTSTNPHLDFEVWIDGVAVDPYDSNNWLWTAHPPSHGYYTPSTNFTFDQSPEGWTPGYDTKKTVPLNTTTWSVETRDFDNIDGFNPGVVSPTFSAGINTDQFKKIWIRVGVSDYSIPVNAGKIWIKIPDGNWDHSFMLNSIGGPGYNDNYFSYEASLCQNQSLDISQFSIELHDGAMSQGDIWTFDEIRLISSYTEWDFSKNSQGWTLTDANTDDFSSEDGWKIDPLSKNSEIKSPYLEIDTNDYKWCSIELSMNKPEPITENFNIVPVDWKLEDAVNADLNYQSNTDTNYWQVDPEGSDPRVIIPYPDGIDTNIYDRLSFSYSIRCCQEDSNDYLFVYFGYGNEGFKNLDGYYYQSNQSLSKDNKQYTYTAYLPADKVINSLRIDPVGNGIAGTTDMVSFRDFSITPKENIVFQTDIAIEYDIENTDGYFKTHTVSGVYNRDNAIKKIIFKINEAGKLRNLRIFPTNDGVSRKDDIIMVKNIKLLQNKPSDTENYLLFVTNELAQYNSTAVFASNNTTSSECSNKSTYYLDSDNDGYSNGTTTLDCLKPLNYKLASELISTTGDCDDGDSNINPDSPDSICDGIDNNCDGQIDEGAGVVSCGFGACMQTVNVCANGQMNVCIPGTPSQEICYDHIDNDCDGKTDMQDVDCGNRAILEVCPSDCAYSSIQTAIDNASVGDIIRVADGTYYENITINKAVTVVSINGADKTIIDGGNNDRAVTFTRYLDKNSILDGFTVTHGSGSQGGGIFCDEYGTPVIRNSTIINNTSSGHGGGIAIWEYAQPSVIDCLITSNMAANNGGGIYGNSGSIMNCTINGNSANNGGGISGSLLVVNGSITNNKANNLGGGILAPSGHFINCTISGNTAQYGGGMYCYQSSPRIVNSVISGNLAFTNGGGIYSRSTPSIISCTVAANRADWYGGAGYFNGGSPRMFNSIFWGNYANRSFEQIEIISGGYDITYCNFEGGGWFTGSKGNIDINPLFVNQRPANEAPTTAGDYHLNGDSPCIDIGTDYYTWWFGNATGRAPIADDIDGNIRPQGNGYDMGAFEYVCTDYWKTMVDDLRITDDSGSDQRHPRFVIDSLNAIHLVWFEEQNGSTKIFYNKIDNQGQTIIPDKVLSSIDSIGRIPELAIDDQNNIFVVWQDRRNGKPDIYYLKIDQTGKVLINETRLTFADSKSRRPTIAIDHSGNAHVVWFDNRDGNFEIYYAKIASIGSVIVGPTRVTNYTGVSKLPHAVVDNMGNVHIVWIDKREGGLENLYYCKLDNNGARLLNEDLQLTYSNYRCTRPLVKIDKKGDIHIIWKDKRDGNWELYYKKLDNNGNTLIDDTRLTYDDKYSGYQSVVLDSDQNIHLVWPDDRAGNREIYYLKMNNVGDILVDTTRLTHDDAFSWKPSIGIDLNNKLHVIWTERLNGIDGLFYKQGEVF